jgi:ABC-type glutathione transport system ATPase component
LSVKQLNVRLRDDGRSILKDVSFDLPVGSVGAIVGGSGSGKTTLGLALLGILPTAMWRSSGEIVFEGRDIARLSPRELQKVRGQRIGMVFQEPVSALDPVYTVGFQIAETLEAHRIASGPRTFELLEMCGVPDPARVAGSYPHELSGGLRQRAMIAQAIACGPTLLIADEATSSLDVMLQAKIIELFKDLKTKLKLSILLITHDLGVARALADHVVVLSRGEVVEQGPMAKVLSGAGHSYTRELIAAEEL